MAITTGISNAFEHGFIIQYEIAKGKFGGYNKNYIENVMADISEYAGYGRRSGELTYKTVDFSVSLFLSFGALVKLKNPKRLLNLPVSTRNGVVYPTIMERWFGDKGGFFLWHALRSDFTHKFKQMPKPLFLHNAGMSGNRLRLLLSEETDN